MWGKLALRKHALLGGSEGNHNQENFEFRTSEITSAGFSDQVSVAKIIHICSIQEALSLHAIQLLRKLLQVLNVLWDEDPRLFQSRADSFARDTSLKLRQANVRAQAKVARARARVCRGSATPLIAFLKHDKLHSWSVTPHPANQEHALQG